MEDSGWYPQVAGSVPGQGDSVSAPSQLVGRALWYELLSQKHLPPSLALAFFYPDCWCREEKENEVLSLPGRGGCEAGRKGCGPPSRRRKVTWRQPLFEGDVLTGTSNRGSFNAHTLGCLVFLFYLLLIVPQDNPPRAPSCLGVKAWN